MKREKARKIAKQLKQLKKRQPKRMSMSTVVKLKTLEITMNGLFTLPATNVDLDDVETLSIHWVPKPAQDFKTPLPKLKTLYLSTHQIVQDREYEPQLLRLLEVSLSSPFLVLRSFVRSLDASSLTSRLSLSPSFFFLLPAVRTPNQAPPLRLLRNRRPRSLRHHHLLPQPPLHDHHFPLLLLVPRLLRSPNHRNPSLRPPRLHQTSQTSRGRSLRLVARQDASRELAQVEGDVVSGVELGRGGASSGGEGGSLGGDG